MLNNGDAPRPRRGMMGIILAFVPWILYWSFPAPWGLTGGLAGSALLLARQVGRGKPKLMDGVTLAFFVAAGIMSYGLHSPWFARWEGVLVFAVLAAMALVSLAVRSPFTLQYAREDWPQEFWQEPLFVRTNVHITLAWALAFLYGAGAAAFNTLNPRVSMLPC